MSSIDQQIAELQQQKAMEEYDKRKADAAALLKLMKEHIGKSFVNFGGASMSGTCQWTFLTIRTVQVRDSYKGDVPQVEVCGDSIHVHVAPAYLYKRTLYNRRWTDPEYNKSGGSDRYESSGEHLSPSSRVFCTVTPSVIDGRRNLPPIPPAFQTARVEEHPYTTYGGWMIFDSVDDFNYKYKPIIDAEMQEVIELAEDTQNLVWSKMLARYNADYKKVWSEGDVLAVTNRQAKVVTEYLKMLDDALQGGPDRFNILKEFAAFMKSRAGR